MQKNIVKREKAFLVGVILSGTNRTQIDEQLNDDDLYVPVSQVLTADNWYSGYDINTAEKYTADLINDILNEEIYLSYEKNSITPLEIFVQRIKNTYYKEL